METKRLKLFIRLLLLVLDVTHGQESQFAELKGDVTVAGMFQIYRPNAGKCGEVVTSSVMALEATKWVFRNLNQTGYFPFDVGLLAYPTCRLLEQAVENTYDILRRIADNRTQNHRNIVGLLGPEFSSEAEVVSTVIGRSRPENRILQVGFSTTAASLSDSTKYPNFFRIIPDDSYQVKVILSLIKLLEWNRIGIVYDNDTYGIGASNSLKELAEKNGICVPVFRSITVDTAEAVDTSEINSILDDIALKQSSPVGGILYFTGAKNTARALLLAAERFQEDPALIFSDGIEAEESVFQYGGSVLKKSKGSFAVGSPKLVVTEFQTYWEKLFKNVTMLLEESNSNPWLLDIYQLVKNNCKPSLTSSCPNMTDDDIKKAFPTQPLYVQYSILAALVLSKTLKEVHTDICGSGKCTNFSTSFKHGMMIEKIKSLKLVFDNDFDLEIRSLQGRNISFQSNGDVSVQSDKPVYEVFNFRRATSEFKFIRVGEYKDKLDLNFSDIRDYDSTGKELLWPNLTKVQCSPGKICDECISSSIPDRFTYLPGDFYVVGIVPVYDIAEPFGCGIIRDFNGYQIVQSMAYAVKKINDNTDVFPKQKIGLIVLNSCNNRFVITKKIIELYRNGLRMDMGYNLNMSDTSLVGNNILDLKDRILGFIGGLSSGISIPISEILQPLKYVQISYASTNPSLSDRNLHPYFMRTVTPDNKQADVIIKILLEMKSEYIQVVYSESSYGVGGRDSIRDAAIVNKICIAQEIMVKELPDGNYYNIIEELRKKPYAKIVIIFLSSNIVPLVMKAFSANSGEFMFIGSESWGHNPKILEVKANDFLESSLTLSLEMVEDEDVVSYVQGMDPTANRQNAWLNSYLEARLGCYYPWSYDKSRNRPCTERENLLNQTDFEMDTWSIFAYNSILALLKGADQFFKSTCGPTTMFVCPSYATNPEQLIETLKSVRLNITKGVQTTLNKVFDNNGDGTVGYTIYYIQKDSDNLGRLQYLKIGEYQPGINFEFNHTGLKFRLAPSTCPNKVACSHCNFNTESATSKAPDNSVGNTYLIGLGVAVGILLIAFIVSLAAILIMKRRNTKDQLKRHAMNVQNQTRIVTVDCERFNQNLRDGRSESSAKSQRSLPNAPEDAYHTIPGHLDILRTVTAVHKPIALKTVLNDNNHGDSPDDITEFVATGYETSELNDKNNQADNVTNMTEGNELQENNNLDNPYLTPIL